MDARTYNYRHFDDTVERGVEAEEFARFAERLHAGEPAPGFRATRLDDGVEVEVSDLWRRRDVVLEFGSFT